MTLRTRLTALLAVILAISVGAVGVVLSQSVKDTLMAPIDENLNRLGDNLVRSDGPPPGRVPNRQDSPEQPRPEGRNVAIVQYIDGELHQQVPSGFGTDPDPLPNVDASIGNDLAVGEWHLVNLTSEDGSLGFRGVVAVTASDPASPGGAPTSADSRVVSVFAQPLDSVEASVARLRRAAVVAALLALLLGGSFTWLMVWRAFRPVDETVKIAARIEEGDLSLRVPEPDQPTELRSLGRSINTMLDGIEAARGAEVAARASLTRFVADASHEMRTPIAAVSGYAELLRSGELDEATQTRSVDRISAESARMQRLVDDLLTLASHDSGYRRTHHLLNLSAVVADAIEDARAIDADRTYTSTITPELRVSGDEEQLLQCAANLLANIRVHTPPGTNASVVIESTGDNARLTVADDGPGIPEPQRERLFDRFFRAQTASSQASGTGLGLAIVSALVNEHRGTLEVHSDDDGTRFKLELPLAQPNR